MDLTKPQQRNVESAYNESNRNDNALAQSSYGEDCFLCSENPDGTFANRFKKEFRGYLEKFIHKFLS